MSLSAHQSFSSALLTALLVACVGCTPGGTGEPTQTSPEAPPVAQEERVNETTPVETTEHALPVEDTKSAEPAETGEKAAASEAPDTPGQPEDTSGAPDQNLDTLVALLSAFEAPPPTLDQIKAATTQPASSLILLSKDAKQTGAVRQGSLRALGQVGGESSVARLLEVLKSDSIAAERRAAVQGADSLLLSSAPLRDAVVHALNDPSAGVARAAVRALADVPSSRVDLETLSKGDVPAPVRRALDEALGLPAKSLETPKAAPAASSTRSRGTR